MIRGRLAPATLPATDAPPTAAAGRRRVRRLGRLIYLLLVVGFALYLLAVLVGHLVVLNATGIVTSNRFVVGVAYTARVVEVAVEPGDMVTAGQPLGRLESTQVLGEIATLTQNLAGLETQRRAIEERQRIAASLLPVAERRLERVSDGASQLDEARAREVTSLTFQSTVLREAFEAERDVETLRAQRAGAEAELAGITASVGDVSAALGEVRRSYADGRVVATVGGTVAANVAATGQVLRPGEPLLELLTGAPYVLAYLPNGRLYGVDPGERVVLTDGVRTIDGTVSRLDLLADDLPPQFQSAFGARDRQQIVRIEFDGTSPFPLQSRIRVLAPWSPSHLLSRLFGMLAGTP